MGQDEGMRRMITQELELGVHQHDVVGEKFLQQLGVPNEVTDYVRGHVDAKRYLTFKKKDYYDS